MRDRIGREEGQEILSEMGCGVMAKAWYRRPEEACGNAGDAHPVGSH